ncbi:MAG TPA: hypothetical protein ENH20_00675 [Candidatus Pacearchaeota archaeon]|nr:hypothetical protein [Candidatus Pacearchaeota archaeon]
MDYGGIDRRTTKKDLKRKRIARGYKRGGKFRTANVDEDIGTHNSVPSKVGTDVPSSSGKRDKMGKVVEWKSQKRGKRKV